MLLLEVYTIICLGVYRHLVSGHENVTTLTVVYYARYTRTIHSKQCCNLYKYELSLTNPRDALHHGKCAENKCER